MTDLVLVAVLVLMALLLGAASLAIVLLYRGWKSNRALITDLKAQVAAQQIAALTTGLHPPALGGVPPAEEPVRRRRHLALYIGGGVVAAFWAIGDRIRSYWRGHRALTVTAAATVATVSTAAAFYLTPTGDSTATEADQPGGVTSVPDYSPGRAGLPDDGTSDTGTEDGGPLFPVGETTMGYGPADQPAKNTDTPPAASTDDQDAALEGADPGETAQDPADTAEPLPGAPGAQVPEPRPGQEEPPVQQPTPEPSPTPTPDPGPQPSPGGKPPTEDGGLICLDLPPLLDLCVL